MMKILFHQYRIDRSHGMPAILQAKDQGSQFIVENHFQTEVLMKVKWHA